MPARPLQRTPQHVGSGTLASAQHALRRLVLQAAARGSGKAMLTTAVSVTSVVGLVLMVVRMQQQGGLVQEMAWVERWLHSGL